MLADCLLLVPDKKVGLIAEPNAESIAEKVKEYFDLGEEFFLPHLREEKKKYSWEKMVEAILKSENQTST